MGALGLACVLISDVGLAQNVDAEKVFGQAVHQYFAGEYTDAVEDLSLALDAGAMDPRLYYYRGLAHLELDHPEAAKEDFQAGAELEMLFEGKRQFNIGRSLMRVQGATRMMIERARAEAKTKKDERLLQGTAINRRAALAALRAAQVGSDDGQAVVPDEASAPRPNLPDLSSIDDPTAPFGDQPLMVPADPTTGSDDESLPPPAEEDPFAEPATDAAGGTDPFAEPNNGAADSPPADDPFAEPAGDAAADPFAEPENPPADDPFAEPTQDNPPADGSTTSTEIPENVRGGKVLSRFFGVLTSPVRKAAKAGANAIENASPSGLPGADSGAEFPGQGNPPGGNPPGGFGDDPFGN